MNRMLSQNPREARMHSCLERHGDARACIHELLKSFYEPDELNGSRARIS